jgi:hypothetical protein
MDKKKFESSVFVALLIFAMTGLFLEGTTSSAKNLTQNLNNPNPAASAPSYSVTTSAYRGIPYDLYCPSNFSGSLVILAGGILGEKHYLAGWGITLAENGYAALAFSTKEEDLDHVSQYVEDCKNNLETLLPFVFSKALFPISINQNEVSLVGMSGGGSTVLSINDTRITADIAICPYYVKDVPIKNTCPALIVTGENDTISPQNTNGQVYYDKLAPDKMMIEQFGIGHDIGVVGWKYVCAWLDYCTLKENAAYSTLTGAGSDPGILSYKSEFSKEFSLQL